jgi:hypothetical protein
LDGELQNPDSLLTLRGSLRSRLRVRRRKGDGEPVFDGLGSILQPHPEARAEGGLEG